MIAIIDYNAGNLTSVRLAFESIGVDACITADPKMIAAADRVVFPGVGAAAAAMRHLGQSGLDCVIRQVVERGTPFLGICLGTQIICSHTDENGGVACLGLIEGEVRAFCPANPRDKVPHMGWNSIQYRVPHPLFRDIPDGTHFYFVHSYYPCAASPSHVLAKTDYAGVSFAAVLGCRNLVATQFHPEKSGPAGLAMLRNFSGWDGESAC